MYSNNEISLRPQYLGKREWKYGCYLNSKYNYIDLLSKNNRETSNDTNIDTNIDNNSSSESLNLYDIPFYNKTSEYIKNVPKYVEQYSECNYDVLDKISHLYRNLLSSNEFDKFYIKKNSLKQFNNISRIATNKLHKTTIPDNTINTTNTFNVLLKTNQKIIDNKKNLASISFVDDEYIINNSVNTVNNDDNFSDDYDQEDYCESSSYPKDDLDF
jgi:hypothetical protein